MDKFSIWQSVLAELELSISAGNFSTWIKPIEMTSIQDDTDRVICQLKVPSAFHQQIIEGRYYGQISDILGKIIGKKTELRIQVQKGKQTNNKAEQEGPLFKLQRKEQTITHRQGKKSFLNPRLTFDTFVVGSSNQFAYAAAQGVVKNPGKKYNPLFVYGGVGLGKTHLMHAIGHALLDLNPDLKILYISAETFANELIASLQTKKTSSFKKKYRSCDVLLVDDIQFISGKEYTQEEFFHTFNQLYMAEKQIILTSDRPPEEIPKIEERLSSRFMGGLTVDIQPPDFEMRVGILKQKTKEMNLEVGNEILEIIANKVVSNVRELEGTLRKIVAMADLQKEEISEEFVKRFFGEKETQKQQKIRPSSIVSRTARYFKITSADLKGKSRKAEIALARHMAMYLLKTELNTPYERIGELLGGRDHTTAMHGVEKINKLIQKNQEVRNYLREIKNLLYS